MRLLILVLFSFIAIQNINAESESEESLLESIGDVFENLGDTAQENIEDGTEWVTEVGSDAWYSLTSFAWGISGQVKSIADYMSGKISETWTEYSPAVKSGATKLWTFVIEQSQEIIEKAKEDPVCLAECGLAMVACGSACETGRYATCTKCFGTKMLKVCKFCFDDDPPPVNGTKTFGGVLEKFVTEKIDELSK